MNSRRLIRFFILFWILFIAFNTNAQDLRKLNKSELKEYVDFILKKNDSLVNIISLLEKDKLLLGTQIESLEKEINSKSAEIKILNESVKAKINEIRKLSDANNIASSSCNDSISYLNAELKINKMFFEWLFNTRGYCSKIVLENPDFLLSAQNKDWQKLQSLISWSDITTEGRRGLVYLEGYNEFPNRQGIGNIVIVSAASYHYADGIPNEDYGHDNFLEEEKIYFVKSGDSVAIVDLEGCFNLKKDLLLKEINSIAQQQLDEESKGGFVCELNPKLPLTFRDLEMKLDEGNVCFIYLKGNLACGEKSVCFEKIKIEPYLK